MPQPQYGCVAQLVEHEASRKRIYESNTLFALNSELRQVVIGMTATGFSIADQSDKLSMDVVGFDASAPNVIASFIRGEV